MERQRKPDVFVAMPFGMKRIDRPLGSAAPIDVNFDDIWTLLIRPALEHAGCRPYRADEEMTAGDIRTDMFFELVTGEFVLADISTLNANVFYELGIRHGVSPRGVLMIDGGWCRRPFDVAPDRTFSYHGALFESEAIGGENWHQSISGEVEKLATRLRHAIANDGRTTSSPVYKELGGLEPVNWTNVRNAKAKYFGGQFQEWHARVRKAKRQSHVGDILTLSRDAPNRFFERQLRLDAARALYDLGRYERALELLRAMTSEDPECPETRYTLAKTLHGLAAKASSAEDARKYNVMMEGEIEEAIRRGGRDPEACRLLGRIYKYRWRHRWEKEESLEERKRLAALNWQTAEKALFHYQMAQTLDLNLFHAGINVISLLRLRAHLGLCDSERIDDDPDLLGLIKTAARNRLQQTQTGGLEHGDESDSIWACAVLGEVGLLSGDVETAQQYFHRATTDPDVSVSQLVSLNDQLRMYEFLAFEIDCVKEIRAHLEEQLTFQREKRMDAHLQAEKAGDAHIVAFRGQSFKNKRFEQMVLDDIDKLLDDHNVGSGDLVICGARRGAEILFAEQCLLRHATVRLVLPVNKAQFVAEAVRVPRSDWERRFHELADSCEVVEQYIRLGPAPAQLDPYERNNDWCLEIARTEYGPNFRPLVVAFAINGIEEDEINERGSLEHFAQCARELELNVERVDCPLAGLQTTMYPQAGSACVSIDQGDGPQLHRFRIALRVGRATDNDVVLTAPSISRYHLLLEPDVNGLWLSNLSRRPNATLLAGQALEPESERTHVEMGQTIELVDGTKLTVVAQSLSNDGSNT